MARTLIRPLNLHSQMKRCLDRGTKEPHPAQAAALVTSLSCSADFANAMANSDAPAQQLQKLPFVTIQHVSDGPWQFRPIGCAFHWVDKY